MSVIAVAAASIAAWLYSGTQMGDRSRDALQPGPAIPQPVEKEVTPAPESENGNAATDDRQVRNSALKASSTDVAGAPESQMPSMALRSTTTAGARESLSAAAKAVSSHDSALAFRDANEADHRQIVTIDNVESVFNASPFCQLPTDCEVERGLARLILGEPKRESDSWAYGMEFEMRHALDELITEDPRARGKDVVRQVTCNVYGCVVYRAQAINPLPPYAERLARKVRERSGIEELNGNGTWPHTPGFYQGPLAGRWFEIIVFER